MTEVDAAGIVTFHTIVPGRYMGRAFHVHYAVRLHAHTMSAIQETCSSAMALSTSVPTDSGCHCPQDSRTEAAYGCTDAQSCSMLTGLPCVQVHIPTNSSTSEEVEWDSAYVSHIGQIFFEDSIGDTVHQYSPYSTVSNDSITYLGDDDVYTGDTNLIADYTPVDPDAFEAGAVATIQAIVDTSAVTTFVGDYVRPDCLPCPSSIGNAGCARLACTSRQLMPGL